MDRAYLQTKLWRDAPEAGSWLTRLLGAAREPSPDPAELRACAAQALVLTTEIARRCGVESDSLRQVTHQQVAAR